MKGSSSNGYLMGYRPVLGMLPISQILTEISAVKSYTDIFLSFCVAAVFCINDNNSIMRVESFIYFDTWKLLVRRNPFQHSSRCVGTVC